MNAVFGSCMFELNNGKSTCRVIGARAAESTAATMAKRWRKPVSVYAIRKRDGRKVFLKKVK